MKILHSKVVIFGYGISGMLAAWACKNSGVDCDVYADSLTVPKISGFVYLHDSCDLPLVSYKLEQKIVPPFAKKDKAIKFYSEMVYDTIQVKSHNLEYAFDNPVIDIYSAQQAVSFLQDQLVGHCNMLERKFQSIDEMVELASQYEVAFSTVPLDKVDRDGYYPYTKAYLKVDSTNSLKNVVYYNGGSKYSPYYRWGQLFGNSFQETRLPSGHPKEFPIQKVITAEVLPKVPPRFILCGRYGAWNKDIMSHDVYYKVKDALEVYGIR